MVCVRIKISDQKQKIDKFFEVLLQEFLSLTEKRNIKVNDHCTAISIFLSMIIKKYFYVNIITMLKCCYWTRISGKKKVILSN